MHSTATEQSSQMREEQPYGPHNIHLAPKLQILEFLQFDNRNGVMLTVYSIRLALLLHIIMAYLMLETEAASKQMRNSITDFLQNRTVYSLLEITTYAALTLQILALAAIVAIDRKCMGWRMGHRVVKLILPFSEATLCLSSFLFLFGFLANVWAFVGCSAVSLVACVGENWTDRKMESYQSSQLGGVLFKLIQIFTYFTNSLLVAFTSSIRYFYILNFCLGLLVLGWYVYYGVTLTPFSTTKYLTMVFMSAYCMLMVLFLERIILKVDILVEGNLCKSALLVGLTFFFWRQYAVSRRWQFKDMDDIEASVMEIKYMELQLISSSKRSSCEAEAFVVGLLKMHQRQSCHNPQCYTHLSACYDPATHARIDTTNLLRDRQSMIRFFIKCLYQRSIASNNKPQLLLDYTQFLLSQSFDIFHISRAFRSVELCQLTLLDHVRLFKLKMSAKHQSSKVNELVYEGNLDIESVATADGLFEQLCIQVTDYLENYLNVWKTINSPNVNITFLKQSIQNNFKQLDSINQKWSLIDKYRPFHSKWNSYYQLYRSLVRNQQIKSKSFGDSSSDNMNSDQQPCTVIKESVSKDLLLDKSFLFDATTMYLQTYLMDGVAYISKANLVFREITGYSERELMTTPVKQLLPIQIKESHDHSIVKWLEKGESNNDADYPINFTTLTTVEGKVLPVIKYFKVIVNLHPHPNSFLSFVCMLKLNTNQPQVTNLTTKKNIFEAVNPQSVMNNFLEKQVQGKTALRVDNNPFTKQEIFQPIDVMDELIKLKRSLRCLIFILLLITIGLLAMTQQNANDLNNYSLQYLNFLNLYRYPMAFGKNILKTILKVGNQTKAVNQIHFQVDQISLALSNPKTVQSIFDEGLNLPNTFYPFQNNSFNKGIGYNQIDLIYYMASCIQSLNTIPVNRTGAAFTNLNMYIAPSYDQLINSTKIQFHYSFQSVFKGMISNQLIVLGVEIAVFVFTIVYILLIVYRQFRKNKECLKIIVQFRDEQIKKIILYCKKVNTYFQSFNQMVAYHSDCKTITKQLTSIQFTEDLMLHQIARQKGDLVLNKKNKNIYHTSKQAKREARSVAAIICLVVTILGVIVSFEIGNIIVIERIKAFQQDGFYFLRYFPATSVLGHAILQRYYNQLYPTQIDFYPQRYAQSISDLSLIGNSEYIGTPYLPDSQYFQDQKNYLFGNPCTYNPAVLAGAETSMTKCLTIYNSTFSRGITNFLRASEWQITSFLNKKIDLTTSQVDQVTSALTLVAYYITDAIYQWSNEFTEMIRGFNFESGMHCISICVFLILFHFTVCQYLLFPHLMADFTFTRRVFEFMVPEEILANEKIIRQKFIANGILSQS